jgi:hypothetical protein
MAAITGTQILNPGMQGISVPSVTPFLVVPQGKVFDLVSLIFTNTGAVAQTVYIFRDSLSNPPVLTVVVGALAGVGAVAAVQQAYAVQLSGGEALYAVPAAVTALGYVSIEVDGYPT